MQKFYIHKDEQQQGPFTLEELKAQMITRETMVWFEGKEDWKKAIEVDELQDLFKNIPPPLQKGTSKTSTQFVENKTTEVAHKSFSKGQDKKTPMLKYLVIAFVIVSCIGVFLYSNQQTKIQRQLEEQNAKILEQERIEAERKAEEERQREEANAAQRKAELESLNYEYDQAIVNLRSAKIRLDEIQKFQLLRSASEKQSQVDGQLEVIRSWEKEVDRLKQEIDKY